MLSARQKTETGNTYRDASKMKLELWLCNCDRQMTKYPEQNISETNEY